MATVGDQLTSPEEGWKRYNEDIPQISYSGTWHKESNGAYYGGTRFTQNREDMDGEITFYFTKTKLRIVASMYPSYSGGIEITIDDISYEYSLIGNSGQYLVFEVGGLSDTKHKAIIKKKIAGSYTIDNNIDAIDIDAEGRLLHPDEVISIDDLEVGKRIRCHYTAPISGQSGMFSSLGEETYEDGINDFLPTTPIATPNGDFYFIMVEDWNGKKRLIADRNLQNNISWDTLNNNGLVFGRNAEIDLIPLVPVMSDSMTEGVTITADSNYGSDYGWKAFDGSYTISPRNFWYVTSSFPSGGHWLKVDFGENNKKIVDKITLSNFVVTGSVYSLKDWELYGSNDDVEYVKLIENTFPNKSALLGFDIPPDKRALYRFYRINILNGYHTNVGILEAQLYSLNDNFKKYNIITRLMTGGVTSSDTNNEWDKYIVNSELNGTIIPADIKLWNITKTSMVSTTPDSSNTYRVVRGSSSSASYRTFSYSNYLDHGYRPLLEIEKLTDFKILIQEENNIKKWADDQWVTIAEEPLEESLFNQVDEGLPPVEAFNQLADQFEIYVQTELSSYDDELSIKAIPKAVIVTPTKDISIRSVETIDSFTLNANIGGQGVVKVAVSFDRGNTWHTRKNNAWSEISLEVSTMQIDGMDPTTLNAITSTEWSQLRGASETIRFAYLLSMENETDILEVQDLVSQMDMKGTWKKAVHGSHYDYEYPNNDELLVTIFEGGDYKINY